MKKIIQRMVKQISFDKRMNEGGIETSSGIDTNLSPYFYEVDYLPENDKMRCTISPESRREILKQLLELNHKIHEEEVVAGLWEKKKKAIGIKNQQKLFMDKDA